MSPCSQLQLTVEQTSMHPVDVRIVLDRYHSVNRPVRFPTLYTLAMSAAVYAVHAARWAQSNHRVTMQDLQDSLSQNFPVA